MRSALLPLRGLIVMAMSHADCDHPRTPAGRAACRAAGGPRPTGEHIDVTGPRLAETKRSPIVAVAPRGRARRAPAVVDAKPRAIRTIGDMPNVPHVFSSAITAAWENGWDVRTGHPYNDTEKRVLITSAHGELALVWRDGTPHVVWGVFWRPGKSSITHRLTTGPIVSNGIVKLQRGDRIEDPE